LQRHLERRDGWFRVGKKELSVKEIDKMCQEEEVGLLNTRLSNNDTRRKE
jgi:hypothetical protein